MELDAFNDFAESVKAMPSREKQLPKLKALLEHFEVTNLSAAASLVEHIGDYILTPEISSPLEAGNRRQKERKKEGAAFPHPGIRPLAVNFFRSVHSERLSFFLLL